MIAVTYSDDSLHDTAEKIAEHCGLPLVKSVKDNSFSIYLELTLEKLQLRILGPKAPGPVFVEFIHGALGHRLKFGGGRRQLIGRAVGVSNKETLRVIDVTGGLGRDACVLANLGCDVTMIESSPIVAALLRDGMQRATSVVNFQKLKLNLIEMDSLDYLKQLSVTDYPDVIYLDPMFPERDSSALVKKEMRILKEVVGNHCNDLELFQLSKTIAKKRVVVKRHRDSPTIDHLKPDLIFSGKSSRFDVVLIK